MTLGGSREGEAAEVGEKHLKARDPAWWGKWLGCRTQDSSLS